MTTNSLNEDNEAKQGPVLHIIAVSFHHKKGCIVEYAYPSLVDGTSEESGVLPPAWKFLPTLALPDGAHNYSKDTIYFHLKNKDEHAPVQSTVYGVSCYRQIDAKEVVKKTDDITRGTVQKCICILTSLPYYGAIATKLEIVTHAWFDQKDFTNTKLLKDAYFGLQASASSINIESQIMMGIHVHEAVRLYRHKILVLFKLLMLERRVVFFMSPVGDLCNTILSLLSLFPGLLEHGLVESVANFGSQLISPNLKERKLSNGSEPFIEVGYTNDGRLDEEPGQSPVIHGSLSESPVIHGSLSEYKTDPEVKMMDAQSSEQTKPLTSPRRVLPPVIEMETKLKIMKSLSNGSSSSAVLPPEVAHRVDDDEAMLLSDDEEKDILVERKMSLVINESITDLDTAEKQEAGDGSTPPTPLSPRTLKKLGKLEIVPVTSPTTINIDPSGLPLAIFTKGSVCHPYLSLCYYDILEDINVRSFVIGVSNVLFTTKTNYVDAIIEDGPSALRFHAKELQKQLQLTTEDMRFADMLMKRIDEAATNESLDNTEWEGGDEWIRAQFKDYLQSLLATVLSEDEHLLQAFNPHFIKAWKTTHNYKIWRNTVQQLEDMIPGHPCMGGVTFTDVKLQLARSERGRKINAVMSQAGKAVQDTSKVVGGALNNAKSLMSNWWSGATSGGDSKT